MNFLNKSFTAYLGLPFFLSICILLTGRSLIPACKPPLIWALRFDSPEWQLQWGDTGGTVRGLENPKHKGKNHNLRPFFVLPGSTHILSQKF